MCPLFRHMRDDHNHYLLCPLQDIAVWTQYEKWGSKNISNAGFWEVVFILQRQKCPSKLITHVYKQSWWHSVHCRCCRFMPGFRASTVSCRMQLMKLKRMMPFEIFVCCILMIFFTGMFQKMGTCKLLKLHLPEDIERNTDHTESIRNISKWILMF